MGISTEQVDGLKRYVLSKAEPEVNKSLRKGCISDSLEDIKLLDSLVTKIDCDSKLFRGIDYSPFSFEVGEVFYNPAFMSSTKDVDVAFGSFTKRSGGILLVITGPTVRGIDVPDIIGESTYESEVILDRGSQFLVTSKIEYSKGNLFQNKSEYASNLQDKYPEITDVTVYEISVVPDKESHERYFRPEWTCGRYNAKHHIALMYNLLEGVVHYFEELSADVISEILSVPKNGAIDISRLMAVSGLDRDPVEAFLNELVNVGLLTPRVYLSDEILGIRKMICEKRKSSMSEFTSPSDEEINQDIGLEMSTAEMRYAYALKEDRIITSVMFELTYNCSEQCIHCYNIGASRNDSEQSERHLLNEMSLSDYKKVIDDLYNQGLVKICLTGGDPFSKPCIWELIDYVYNKGIAFDIFTNGQMLVGNEEKLANYYPRLVGISIYSAMAEVHDRITRRPGSFDKSEKVLDALCNLGVPLNVKCCIMRPNLKTYRSVLSFAKKYNAVPQLEINVTDSVSGDKCVSTFLRLTESEYRVVLRDFDIPLYVGKEARYFMGAKRCMSDKACGAGENSMCITPDGECIPCCTFHYSFGNIMTASVEEVLNSDKRRWWLSCTLDKYEECARHDYCDFCNLCPGVNFSETKTPLKAGENNCFIAKIRYRLTQELLKGKDPLCGKSIDEAIAELEEPQIANISRIRYNE